MSIVRRRTKLNIKSVSWEHMKMKTYENIWKWKQQQQKKQQQPEIKKNKRSRKMGPMYFHLFTALIFNCLDDWGCISHYEHILSYHITINQLIMFVLCSSSHFDN